ncbi:hypothetical protein EDB83DRAFT_2512327 [Lactarius deliciosus]|nr:hypothetical protein EDB83DRAFT_2512327 [Lactarius deliciosus]
MDPSQANSRESQRQAIDTKIESLESSIRELRLRRNALAPISFLPTDVFAAIFSFLRIRVPIAPSPSALGGRSDHLAWLRVTHVCHHWREIILNQPLFWSHIDFTTLTSAGAVEILARAKMAPLYLEARVRNYQRDDGRFSVLQKELPARVSHIRHLGISTQYHLRKTLEGLVSPAPALEYLSLDCGDSARRSSSSPVYIPDTLFDGATPRLSCLELRSCDICWKSPLLKGLRHLEINTPSGDARPSLSDWLDVLDELPRLKTLTLHSASPIAPPGFLFPSGIERTITLASLSHLNISASVRDCGLALAHLLLPTLTQLSCTARSCSRNGIDTQPLQSVAAYSDGNDAEMFAWTVPVDVRLPYTGRGFPDTKLYTRAELSARVAFSFFSELFASLVTFTLPDDPIPFDKQSWLLHAPRWPLLQRVRLAPFAGRGFTEMLLEDNGEREFPLLPSLTELVLVDTSLSARRTLHLCDALMKRVEQRVPLETLDLRTCFATSRAIELLSEIVVDVLSPETSKNMASESEWHSEGRGHFVTGDVSRYILETDSDEDEDEMDDW